MMGDAMDEKLNKQTPPLLNDDVTDKEAERTAVALHYNHADAPKVVAKGRGIVAEKIIEAAREHGVFVKEDPLLSEALGAVELDEEIPVELYLAVAELIGFVLSIKKEAA